MTEKLHQAGDFARVLTEALPYIRRYQGKTVVIKYGGNAMVDETLKYSFARDMVLMKLVGINPVIVHGGGPQISQLLEKVGKKSEFINGLRVTDSETMDIVEMVLGGAINKEIVNLINTNGGYAVGLTGKDGGLIEARQLKISSADQDSADIDVGQVGEIVKINPRLIEVLESHRFIPVIAPIGVDKQGRTYNINADSVAGAIAVTLQAERLMLLTNTPGVLDDSGELIRELDRAAVNKLIQTGVIGGGMLPKIECALDAVDNQVNGTIILDGRIDHVTLLEIFSDKGVGTRIRKESD